MHLFRCSGLLLWCFNALSKMFWVICIVLIRFSGWLLGCCYALAKVLWVVARGLLCSC